MLTYNCTKLVAVNVTKIDGLTLLNVFNKRFNSMLLGLHTLTHLEIPLTNLSQKIVSLLFGVVALFFLFNFSNKSKKMLLKQVKKDFAVESKFSYLISN